MSDAFAKLLAKQHEGIKRLSDDTADMAEQIADEAWDKFEREVDSMIGDSLHWDFADTLKQSLLLNLALSFDDACEKWLTQRIESMNKEMEDAVGEAWQCNTGDNSLASLSKSLRIRQRMEPKFEQIFTRGKPGVLSMLGRIFKDDMDYVINDMEKDAEKDAQRLRAAFYDARSEISGELREVAATLIRRALLGYKQALGGLHSDVRRQENAQAVA